MAESSGLIQALQTRLQLAGLVWRHERRRVMCMLMAACGALGCLFCALLTLQVLAVVMLWPRIGGWSLALSAGSWLGLSALAWTLVRRAGRDGAFTRLTSVLSDDAAAVASIWSDRGSPAAADLTGHTP